MMIDGYFEKLQGVLERIRTTQRTAITQAAEVAQRTIEAGGIIYIFGCGHSHLIALDNFYRAGGLCNVCPILDADLMLHDGAAKSSKMEKMSGLAEPVLERYCLTEKDCLFVISTSGKNAAAVGIMGKIRCAIESAVLHRHAPNSNKWSLNHYRAQAQNEQDQRKELERSIIANLADDVIVAISGDCVDIAIIKTFWFD